MRSLPGFLPPARARWILTSVPSYSLNCSVYVGKLRNRLKVAIAEFRGQLSEMDIKELKLLAEFTHPNVVKFLGVSIPEDRRIPIMMISELCENGDLFDYIRNVPAPPTKIVIKLMLDIARGLAYLHCRDKPVIHRDVKSSNILITSKVVAKVGDFGLARVKHSTRSMIRSLVGTVCYQPPEMWTAHPKYDSKVDVYSCAMVFWEMLQWHKAEKKFPWEGMNEHAIYDTVGAKKLRCISAVSCFFRPSLILLCPWCLLGPQPTSSVPSGAATSSTLWRKCGLRTPRSGPR